MCITLVITSFKKSPQVIQVICVFGKQKSKADLSAGKPPGMLVSEAGLLPLGGGGKESRSLHV